MKILSIFGTRPEAIKMAPVIRELERYPDRFESLVCVTAQHRQMLDQVLEIFRIRPDMDLDLMEENQTLPGFASRALAALSEVIAEVRPDWILVQGDTTTTMMAALAGFYNDAKVGHIEAGLRTDDKAAPYPEEINRRITSVLADYHFPPTERAQQALLNEGVPPDRITVTGNTVIDALFMALDEIRTRDLDGEFRDLFSRLLPGLPFLSELRTPNSAAPLPSQQITSHPSPVTSYQSPVTSYQSPVANPQSVVGSRQTADDSHQSPITNHQSLLTVSTVPSPPVTNNQLPVTGSTQSPATAPRLSTLDSRLSTAPLPSQQITSPQASLTGSQPIQPSSPSSSPNSGDPQAGTPTPNSIILVTGHRRESFGKPFEEICLALRDLAEAFPDIHIVYPVHLNPNVREPVYRILGKAGRVHLIEPLPYLPFLWLMSRSSLILTDSGGIQEEAPSLGIPVLVMREVTERPEGVEAGCSTLVGATRDRIVQGASRLLSDEAAHDRMAQAGNPYGDGLAARRIVSILDSLPQ